VPTDRHFDGTTPKQTAGLSCHDRSVTLHGGVNRLQHDFNQSSETLRVLAVLSPTCPQCLEGYEMLSGMPAGPKCLVLWTAMLVGDSADIAAERGGSDHPCAHYWRRQAGASRQDSVRFLASVHTIPR
jgi:hypothetical protein